MLFCLKNQYTDIASLCWWKWPSTTFKMSLQIERWVSCIEPNQNSTRYASSCSMPLPISKVSVSIIGTWSLGTFWKTLKEMLSFATSALAPQHRFLKPPRPGELRYIWIQWLWRLTALNTVSYQGNWYPRLTFLALDWVFWRWVIFSIYKPSNWTKTRISWNNKSTYSVKSIQRYMN